MPDSDVITDHLAPLRTNTFYQVGEEDDGKFLLIRDAAGRLDSNPIYQAAYYLREKDTDPQSLVDKLYAAINAPKVSNAHRQAIVEQLAIAYTAEEFPGGFLQDKEAMRTFIEDKYSGADDPVKAFLNAFQDGLADNNPVKTLNSESIKYQWKKAEDLFTFNAGREATDATKKSIKQILADLDATSIAQPDTDRQTTLKDSFINDISDNITFNEKSSIHTTERAEERVDGKIVRNILYKAPEVLPPALNEQYDKYLTSAAQSETTQREVEVAPEPATTGEQPKRSYPEALEVEGVPQTIDFKDLKTDTLYRLRGRDAETPPFLLIEKTGSKIPVYTVYIYGSITHTKGDKQELILLSNPASIIIPPTPTEELGKARLEYEQATQRREQVQRTLDQAMEATEGNVQEQIKQAESDLRKAESDVTRTTKSKDALESKLAQAETARKSLVATLHRLPPLKEGSESEREEFCIYAPDIEVRRNGSKANGEKLPDNIADAYTRGEELLAPLLAEVKAEADKRTDALKTLEDEVAEIFAREGDILAVHDNKQEHPGEIPELILATDKADVPFNTLFAGIRPSPTSEDSDIIWFVFKDRKWEPAEENAEKIVLKDDDKSKFEKKVKGYIDSFKARSGVSLDKYKNLTMFDAMFDKPFMSDVANSTFTDKRKGHLQQSFKDKFPTAEKPPMTDPPEYKFEDSMVATVNVHGSGSIGFKHESTANKEAVAMRVVTGVTLLGALGIGSYALLNRSKNEKKKEPAQNTAQNTSDNTQADTAREKQPKKEQSSWVKKVGIPVAATAGAAALLALIAGSSNRGGRSH